MSVSILPRPQAHGSSSLLHDLTSNPLEFGPPVTKASFNSTIGVKEVVMGPRSPPRHAHSLVNGNANGESRVVNGSNGPKGRADLTPHISAQASPSSSRLPTAPIVPSAPNTPSKKGKEKETATQNGNSPNPKPKGNKSSKSKEMDLSWPSQISKKRFGAGLFNPSMACYANATLQILLHTPPVLSMALGHEEDKCLQRRKGFCMLCALRTLVDKHWTQAAVLKAYAPKDVHGNLGQIKKGFNRNRQEDTHEFFRFVTDGLQAQALAGLPKDTPEKVKQATWVHGIWGGQVRSRVVCSRCNKPSDTFDNILDLSLDVNKGGRPRLLGMLSGFVREDKLEGDNKYHCENCKVKAVATKSFKIAKAPPVLTFHLKRFSVNYNSYNGRARADKFNSFIEYPEMLDIAPYMVNPNGDGAKYRLFGVTCHRGVELRFGHYTSYIRSPDGRWWEADDEDMSPTTLQSVLNDKYAYLLSYIRVSDEEYAASGAKSTPNVTPTTAKTGTPQTNGSAHSNGFTNFTTKPKGLPEPSPLKRQWEGESADRPFKRDTQTQSTPPTSRWTNGLMTNDSDRKDPPSPPAVSPSGSPPPSKFGYSPKSSFAPIPTTAFYGNGNKEKEVHDFARKRFDNDSNRHKKNKKKNRDKLGKRGGAPMPFHEGKMHGHGNGDRKKSLIKGMKRKGL